MEYKIVKAKTTETIERNVQKLEAEGWLPWGGVAFGDGVWAQAMEREEAWKAMDALLDHPRWKDENRIEP